MRTYLVLASLIAATACGTTREQPAAETAYINGKVYTVDGDRPWAQAIAISGTTISFVGSDEDVRAHIGDSTEVVDLDGAMVMPGIHDAHGHLLIGGLQFTSSCLLSGGASPETIIIELKACASDTKPGEWIVAGAYWSEQFPNAKPNKAFLDAEFPDNPVFLNEGSVHHALVNSKALEIARIDVNTPIPPGGDIPRDENGDLTGEILESATWLVTQHIPPTSAAENLQAVRWASDEYSRYGITSMQEAAANRPTLEALKAIDEAGDLNLSVAAHIILESPKFAGVSNAAMEALLDDRTRFRTEHISVDHVKFWIDGSPTPPYFTEAGYDSDKQEPLLTNVLVPPDRLNDIVVRLDREGIQAKMHVAGAGAANVALNAIEAARKANPQSTVRHETAHTNLVIPSDFVRYSSLNAVAEVSPTVWHLYGPTLGSPPQRAWQFRTLLESGAHLTVGSDWPVTREPNFFPALQGMLQHGDESIDLASAVDALTINGAQALGLGEQRGSIEVGKTANIIVLDQNIFESAVSEIGKTQVLRTIFEGRVVYTAE